MDRRRFLGGLAAGYGLLAGCVAGAPGTDSDETTVTPADVVTPENGTATGASTAGPAGGDAATTVTSVPMATLGTPGTICEESAKRDPGIYAITDPAFAGDWAGHDIPGQYAGDGEESLASEATVIGLDRAGHRRAYPLEVLWYHEVVNDALGGPLMVTYCPICRSGLVAKRVLDGRTTTFAVTGLLWSPPQEFSAAREVEGRVFGARREGGAADIRHSGNVVVYDDATHSYWSQLLAQAICGPATGTELDVVASTVTTWGEWRETHPDTVVLLPPPHSRVRERNPAGLPGGE